MNLEELEDFLKATCYTEHSDISKKAYIYIMELEEELQRCVKANVILDNQATKIQNNWNELKKFINSGYYDSYIYSSTILNKMQELEGENNNEEESNSK